MDVAPDDLEYQVHATPPGETESHFIASFYEADWQLAEKLGQYLEDKGYIHVEVRMVYLE